MKYVGYKMDFTTALHIGKRKLEDAESAIYADTVFSALCHEALIQGGEESLNHLVELTEANHLKLSDAMPFHNNTYYVPKPMLLISGDERADSNIKKAAKKLPYVPVDLLDKFIAGDMDVQAELEIYETMGIGEVRTMASVKENDDTMPFQVGSYRFNRNWGLYLVIGYEDEDTLYFIEDLLIGLGYSGIGGKRSSGMGKYTLMAAKLPDSMTARLTERGENGVYMNLSPGMASDDELKEVIDNARYMLIRRSGFVSSSTYAERPLKKKDFYAFKAGSVFTRTFDGLLRDVSGEGTHPVYRYAKPVFMEVE